MRLILPVLLLAALPLTLHPLAAQVVLEPSAEDLPPGYPPKLGLAELVEGGKTQVLTTYDFSIGAFDASAWFGEGIEARGFYLTAYPDDNPDARKGVLRIYGHYESWTPGQAPGATTEGLVEWSITEGFRGRRWTSAGKPVEVVVDSFVPQEPGQTSGYGHVTGHYSARVCSGDKDPVVVAPNARCREISGQFETDVQYSP
ncbi:hypothetical protein [Stagnihabitans tardus]|uniref:Secreted protein n=1 Tax=Stagnihabitans tardus TaxID=2699202 RepID=A0AAE4Y5I5_9RHOB|nr:hypothetical protein [Stagnihabitans tardus]NBZ86116.1 hypothetical protein [Stagnihabitans tardus]